ncbi:MAG: hypothetical protein V3V99_01635 [candidate division Zixibacteria bacterium]
MPKLYSIIETMIPRLHKALMGSRPYVPINCEKSPEAAEAIEFALDTYLYKDHFEDKGLQGIKTGSLFGTVFLEPFPLKEISGYSRIGLYWQYQSIVSKEVTI